MELTNEQRKYLGLEQIDPAWERVEIPSNMRNPELSRGKDILFFDGDILRKVIFLENSGSFLENSYHLRTQDHRRMIAPITGKGKPKLLSEANIQNCTAHGMYFWFGGEEEMRGDFWMANYTTQRTYFSSHFAGLPPMNVQELQEFLNRWIAETSERDLEDIQKFARAKRQRCKYKEGDFFRFRYDRRHYGYGRIILDVRKFIKDGGRFWDILAGKPLCISIYHIVTEDPNVSLEQLEKLSSCPAGYIMDNVFFYGEYEIIGNRPLPQNDDLLDYPIMYGQSISALDSQKICYCRGKVYREIPLERKALLQKDFRNNGIGFGPHIITKEVVEECIQAQSNEPYWRRSRTDDLRNPIYKKEREYVTRQMGLE